MGEKPASKIVQVTNIAPSASREQMKSLFTIIGRVDDVRLFPEYDNPTRPYSSKVCYVKFENSHDVMVALHLTNTVFIDRALIIVPFNESKMPDERTAMEVAAPPNATGGLLPPTSDWPSNVVNQVVGAGSGQVIQTVDPKLSAAGLPAYPPLPGNIDASKVEEIRRTVYISNLDSSIVTSEMVLNFFSQVGEVKYVRMAGDESLPTRAAFVEFTDQRTIPTVFSYNGVTFNGKPLHVAHSQQAIVKPLSKNQEAITKEIDEAMKKVNEAHSLITAAVDDDRKRSRSRSRSRDRRRKHRSRSRSHRRSRSRKRSRSKSRKRSRSRSKRSRSRSRRSPRKRRSRSRSRSRERKRREKEREREKDRKSKRSRSPRKASQSSKERKKSKSRTASKSPKREDKEKSLSPPKLDKIDSPSAAPPSSENDVTKSPEMPVSSPVPPKAKSRSPSAGSERKSRSKSPPPAKKRSRSPRRKRRSTSRSRRRSKSPRRKSRSPTRRRRSRSPRRRSRSPRRRRSRSRSRSPRKHRKEKKKDKDRDRSRSRDRKRRRDREDKGDKPKAPVKRDYDEEEKGYDSSDQDKTKAHERSPAASPRGSPAASPRGSPAASPRGSPAGSPRGSEGGDSPKQSESPAVDNLQSVDMDVDSD